jgi:acyl-coenzyme A thioesterase PaaI-like protein
MVHSREMSGPLDIPEPFRAALAGLEEQRDPARPIDAFHHCFGCGPGHPRGLHVRCFKSGGGVLSPVIVPREYEGPPGAVHGGIVAAYMDEILGGAVMRATGRVSVTGELTVRYVKPVPSETPLLGRGALVADHGRFVDVEATLEELVTGRVVATARARFFPFERTATREAGARG